MLKQSLTAMALVLGLAAVSTAEDKYEFAPGGDDTGSINHIGHGQIQEHDLHQVGGIEDFDWIVVPTIARHSYEARVSGSNVDWDRGTGPSAAQFERVNDVGTILTEDVAVVNDGPGPSPESYDRSVRWIATASTTREFVRLRGMTFFTETANEIYKIRFWDTTYSIARWNNSSGQVTVFLIQNMTQVAASGQVDFYTPAGTLLHTEAFTVPANGLFTFTTSSVPALANQSGHAYVAHTAGYGGLAGKAVALEPSTGFSFDTPMTPIPH